MHRCVERSDLLLLFSGLSTSVRGLLALARDGNDSMRQPEGDFASGGAGCGRISRKSFLILKHALFAFYCTVYLAYRYQTGHLGGYGG